MSTVLKACRTFFHKIATVSSKRGDDVDDNAAPDIAHPRPDRLLYVIGDVHGCAGLLDRLVSRIAQDQSHLKAPQADMVFVGDYVDRGPNSRAVIDRLIALSSASDSRITCLGGNHEDMCVTFLDGSGDEGAIWLANGGRETLLSYGLQVPQRLIKPQEFDALRSAARAAVPQSHLDWLRARPVFWTSGDVIVVHAAFESSKPPEDQDRSTLIWGRNEGFLKEQRTTGPWVVHGHTITRPLAARGRRIPVDSGAFATNILTAVAIAPDCPIRYIDTAA